MTSDDSEFEASLRGYRRRWQIINALLAVVVVVGLYFAWAKLLRVPSSSTICEHIWDLGEAADASAEGRGRLAVLARTSGGLADLPDGEARAADACRAYVDAVQAPRGWMDAGALGRCLLASTDVEQMNACWKDVLPGDGDAVLRQRITANTDFPLRRPRMPDTIAPHYDEVLAISERALASCPKLFSPEVGCYTYTWDGTIESRRELAHAIPSEPGALGPDLIALEASCFYDAGTWVKRHPELLDEARKFPLPVQRFGCNYLAQGQPSRLGGCSSRTTFPGGGQVGVDDNLASVSIPYEAGCEDQWSLLTIERTVGDGVFVEVTALFRGSAWDPAVSTPFEIPAELRGDESGAPDEW